MIKEKSQHWHQFARQLGVLFSRLPLTPNVYSWSTLPVAILGFWAMTQSHVVLGVLLFFISGVLDVIDGSLARHLGCATHRGAFLDGSLDRFVDFFLVFSFFWIPLHLPGLNTGQWLSIMVFLSLMPSFEVAYANHRKAVDDPDEKRIWRILNRGEMYILLLCVPLISLYNPIWAGYLFLALVAMSFVTTLQTIIQTLRLSEA